MTRLGVVGLVVFSEDIDGVLVGDVLSGVFALGDVGRENRLPKFGDCGEFGLVL